MSFINLMANDIWSDADITRRTEAMLRTEFSQEAETILNRKVLGATLGTYQLTQQEQADMARYNATAQAAQIAGIEARADMALLTYVLAMEAAQLRLDQPPLTNDVAVTLPELLPEDQPQEPAKPPYTDEELAADAAERAEAQAVLDAATPEQKALYDLRNPPPAPEDTETPPTEGENV